MRTATMDMLVVGAGRVGGAMAALAEAAQWRAQVVSSRWLDDACRLGPEAGLVLITTSDDAIEPVCAALAGRGAFRAGGIVAHCSGALDSGILEPARIAAGCALGSIHPLQTFPTAEAALERLPGAWCFCEGDATAVMLLRRLAEALGCHAGVIARERKPLYHAAAVMACNYLTALHSAALALAQASGMSGDTALEALAPLMEATVAHVARCGPDKALTGPIARGDAGTVALHLAALQKSVRAGEISDNLARLYVIMGRITAEIARGASRIDNRQAEALAAILAEATEAPEDYSG